MRQKIGKKRGKMREKVKQLQIFRAVPQENKLKLRQFSGKFSQSLGLRNQSSATPDTEAGYACSAEKGTFCC